MTTTGGELITINLNSSYFVVDVSVINSVSTLINGGFGISKKMDSNELLLFSGSVLYGFDIVLKEYREICTVSDIVNGATYYEGFNPESGFPNIITPNNDDINDFVDLSEFSRFSILNRWGEEVFNNLSASVWRGENKNGETLSEGVYFMQIQYEDCKMIKSFYRTITILR